MSLANEQQYRIRSNIQCLLDQLKNFYVMLERINLPRAYEKVADTIESVFSRAEIIREPIVLPTCFISQLSSLPSQRERSIELMKNVLGGMFIADTKTLKYVGVLGKNENIASDNIANEIKQEVVVQVVKYFNMHNNKCNSSPGSLPTQACMGKIEDIERVYSIKSDRQETHNACS